MAEEEHEQPQENIFEPNSTRNPGYRLALHLIRPLSPEQIEALTLDQIEVLTPTPLQGLEPKEIEALTPEQLGEFVQQWMETELLSAGTHADDAASPPHPGFRSAIEPKFPVEDETMAETPQNPEPSQYVTHDQFRAGMSELRGQMQEQIGELRQDVAVLKTTVEERFTYITDMMEQRFAHSDQQMEQRFGHIDQQITHLRDDFRAFQTSTTRQLWSLVSVICLAILGGLIKLVFFPTPPTP